MGVTAKGALQGGAWQVVQISLCEGRMANLRLALVEFSKDMTWGALTLTITRIAVEGASVHMSLVF